MKKSIIMFLAVILCLWLFGCGASPAKDTGNTPEESSGVSIDDITAEIDVPLSESSDPTETEAEQETEAFVEVSQSEQYTWFSEIIVGEWGAFADYTAAANTLILCDDGTGSYGTDTFTWTIDYASESDGAVKCCGDNGALTYYIYFAKGEETQLWHCEVSLVDYVDENNWSMTHEDEAKCGQRYNKHVLEILEITAENFEEYFEIRPADDWNVNAAGKALGWSRFYYVFLKPEYAERIAYMDTCIEFDCTCRMDYYTCDIDFENRLCTVSAPFAEIPSVHIDTSSSFFLYKNFEELFPDDYCIGYLQGDCGTRDKTTGDIYYTAVLENFNMESCNGQLILLK